MRHRLFQPLAQCLFIGSILGVLGCASSSATSEPTGPDSAAGAQQKDFDVEAVTQELEKSYVIGPATARRLGLRADWQTDVQREGSGTLERAWVLGDAIVTVDSGNVVTRLRTSDGAVLWRTLIGGAIGTVHGVSRLNDRGEEKFYVTTDGELIVLDDAAGSQIGRQLFERIASTGPATHGRYVIYGSRDGQVIWHQYLAGVPYRANQLQGAISVPPKLLGESVVVVSETGSVMVLDPASARTIWSKQLLDGISAAPAGGNGIVYVAAEDQYLWALDGGTGQTRWKYLTTAALTTPPALIGDRVFQYIPGEGLVAFEANPADAPGGKVVWKAPAVTGPVVGQIGSALFAWDVRAKKGYVLDAARGGVIETVDLPQVTALWFDRAPEGGGSGPLYAASSDGRVTRLTAVRR